MVLVSNSIDPVQFEAMASYFVVYAVWPKGILRVMIHRVWWVTVLVP